MENGKWKTKAQAIFFICLPFAHHANGSSSFVRLMMKKTIIDVIRLQMGIGIGIGNDTYRTVCSKNAPTPQNKMCPDETTINCRCILRCSGLRFL
jgi:hypothetical protein